MSIRHKVGSTRQPPIYKARFVAKRFSQRPGLDFNETYSSVVTHDTFRLLMSIIAADDLEMNRLDIKNAFLIRHLEEEIFMMQPEGYIIPGKENDVCRLHKCINGLKQSSHVWERHFMDFIKQHDFKQNDENPCFLFRVREAEKTFLVDNGRYGWTHRE